MAQPKGQGKEKEPAASVTNVYLHVVEDVIQSVRDEFQSEGVDESVLVELRQYTPVIDIWSIGCIFAEVNGALNSCWTYAELTLDVHQILDLEAVGHCPLRPARKPVEAITPRTPTCSGIHDEVTVFRIGMVAACHRM
ncbi:unnamed protein product [Calypogeia fissa]